MHLLLDSPPVLFEVRCDDHNVQIGGYPWHYIITPHGTMGYFSVHNLKDHKLVSQISLSVHCIVTLHYGIVFQTFSQKTYTGQFIDIHDMIA